MGVGHADFAHASSALCLCAFVTLCHKDRGITITDDPLRVKRLIEIELRFYST